MQCCRLSCLADALLNKGCKKKTLHHPCPLETTSFRLLGFIVWHEDRIWRGERLCKLSILGCMHRFYLLRLKCTEPEFNKLSALMSFIPLFIPYLIASMTLSLLVCQSPLSFHPHFSHIYSQFLIFLLLSFHFPIFLFSLALSPTVFPSISLGLLPSLVQYSG